MDKEHVLSQVMAILCIVLGLAGCFIGCDHGDHFAAFTALAGTVAGAGLQAFTARQSKSVKATDGATVNVDSPATI